MTVTDPDYLLLRHTARGDTTAYRRLLGRYESYCVRFAERMLGDRQAAEDVTQEVWLTVWHEAGHWQPSAKFSTWLYRVMYNACIDETRKKKPHPVETLADLHDSAASPEEALYQRQRADDVRRELQSLPDRQRAAIVLSYYHGIRNEDAADVMEIELNAFQQLLFRARQTLKKRLLQQAWEKEHG